MQQRGGRHGSGYPSREAQQFQKLNAHYQELYLYTEGVTAQNQQLHEALQKVQADLTALQAEYRKLEEEKTEWQQKAMAAEATVWQAKHSEEEVDAIVQENETLQQNNVGLYEENQWLYAENEKLQTEIQTLKQRITSPIAFGSFAYQAYTREQRFDPFLSSEISIPKVKPETFEDRIFKLASRGITTPAHLDPLRMCLTDEEESHEYFEQFIPYIIEEIRAGINAQMDIISKKRLRPFEAHIQPEASAQDLNEQQYIRITCSTIELPRLDHGFYMEAVLIQTEQREPRGFRSREKPEDYLKGFIAIASIKKNYDDEEDDRKSTFSLMLLRSDYQKHIQAKKGPIQLHWLYGLIPSSRAYQVCIDMPKVAFESEFMRARMQPWPSVEERPIEGMNTSQSHVINSFHQTESGLYFVQGPPGTGKTTTTVELLKEWCARHPTERILVCTSSNQALRILLGRSMEAFPHVTMALTGIGKNITDALSDVFVHNYAKRFYQPLVALKRKLENDIRPEERQTFEREINEAYETIKNTLVTLLNAPGQMPVSQTVLESMRRLIREITEQQAALSESEKWLEQLENTIRHLKSSGYILESFLVQRAQIVFATLVSSGRNWLHKQIAHFDLLVIDEASQAVVPEALIPMRFSPTRCIHIGDPAQLSATVISKAAQTGGYGNSLMYWLMKEFNQPFQMLTEQYRMDSRIASWASEYYYDGRLTTAPSVLARESILHQNTRLSPLFKQSCVFFNIRGEEERKGNNPNASIYNEQEALAIVKTALYLLQCGFESHQLGIITFYSAQVERIMQHLNRITGRHKTAIRNITVSTVDGFQGGEHDITMISAVRTNPSVGFLNDPRRINVAMTRAKYARWLFGDINALNNSNSDMPRLLEHSSIQRTDEEELKTVVKY